jgi:hypothetical protein
MGGLRKTTNIFCKGSRQLDEELNPEPPEYEAQAPLYLRLAPSSCLLPETLIRVENAGKENDNDLLQSTSLCDVLRTTCNGWKAIL